MDRTEQLRGDYMASALLRLVEWDDDAPTPMVDFTEEARKRRTDQEIQSEIDRLWERAHAAKAEADRLKRSHLQIIK